jgi:hypothetical protein
MKGKEEKRENEQGAHVPFEEVPDPGSLGRG